MVFNSHKFRNQIFLLAPQYREFDEPERPSEGKGRSFAASRSPSSRGGEEDSRCGGQKAPVHGDRACTRASVRGRGRRFSRRGIY